MNDSSWGCKPGHIGDLKPREISSKKEVIDGKKGQSREQKLGDKSYIGNVAQEV